MRKRDKKKKLRRMQGRPSDAAKQAHTPSPQGDGDPRPHDAVDAVDPLAHLVPQDPPNLMRETGRDRHGMSEDDHYRYARLARRYGL